MNSPSKSWADVYAVQTARIAELEHENTKLREAYEFLLEHGDIASGVICRADYILSNAQKIVMPRTLKP